MNICILFILFNGSAYITPECYDAYGYLEDPDTVAYVQYIPSEYDYVYESPGYYLNYYLEAQRAYCDEVMRLGRYELVCHPRDYWARWKLQRFPSIRFKSMSDRLRRIYRERRYPGGRGLYYLAKPHKYKKHYHGHKKKYYGHKKKYHGHNKKNKPHVNKKYQHKNKKHQPRMQQKKHQPRMQQKKHQPRMQQKKHQPRMQRKKHQPRRQHKKHQRKNRGRRG